MGPIIEGQCYDRFFRIGAPKYSFRKEMAKALNAEDVAKTSI